MLLRYSEMSCLSSKEATSWGVNYCVSAKRNDLANVTTSSQHEVMTIAFCDTGSMFHACFMQQTFFGCSNALPQLNISVSKRFEFPPPDQ